MAAPPKKPGPKPKPKALSIVGQGFGTGRLHKMALLPEAQRAAYVRDVLLGRKSMYQAGKELGFSDMAIARFIAAIPEEEKLRIVAAAMHDAKLQDALKNAREALSGWLFVAIQHGDAIPASRIRRGRDYYSVVPDLDITIPLAVLSARKHRGLTQRAILCHGPRGPGARVLV